MSIMTTSILPLPTVGRHDFTVKQGVISGQNLHHALHTASISSSSVLHSIRPHIEAITDVFDSNIVKHAIRSGGLNKRQQKTILRKIILSDPNLQSNVVVRRALKKVVSHFGKEQGAAQKQANIARRREEYRRDEIDVPPQGVTSINQVMHPADDPNKMTTGSINHPTTFGSANDLRSHPLPGSTPPRMPNSGAFRPKLVR